MDSNKSSYLLLPLLLVLTHLKKACKQKTPSASSSCDSLSHDLVDVRQRPAIKTDVVLLFDTIPLQRKSVKALCAFTRKAEQRNVELLVAKVVEDIVRLSSNFPTVDQNVDPVQE